MEGRDWQPPPHPPLAGVPGWTVLKSPLPLPLLHSPYPTQPLAFSAHEAFSPFLAGRRGLPSGEGRWAAGPGGLAGQGQLGSSATAPSAPGLSGSAVLPRPLGLPLLRPVLL